MPIFNAIVEVKLTLPIYADDIDDVDVLVDAYIKDMIDEELLLRHDILDIEED